MDFDPRDYGDGRDRDDDRVYGWSEDPRDRDDRDRDVDARERDPRDPFVEGLDLPRGLERGVVIDEREREYELNGEDSRMLATIGAFRIVRERDLDEFRDADETLAHLREEGLIHPVQIGPAGQRASAAPSTVAYHRSSRAWPHGTASRSSCAARR